MANEELIAYFEATSQRISHHGNLLWEEEKHYTWWVYVVIGAMLYLLLSPQVWGCLRLYLIVIVSLFGIVVSCIGLRVIRVEGVQFCDALRLQDKILEAMNLSEIRECKHVRRAANKGLCELTTSFFKTMLRTDKLDADKKVGIRDCFQVTLMLAVLLFILLDLVSFILIYSLRLV
jgi:hypothetical protein